MSAHRGAWALLAGALFGLGLAVSGMTDPSRVQTIMFSGRRSS